MQIIFPMTKFNNIALHEIAHKEHIEIKKGNKYKLNESEKILIANYISDYAAHDLANFIAEFKVKLWNNPNLIKQINKMKKMKQ